MRKSSVLFLTHGILHPWQGILFWLELLIETNSLRKLYNKIHEFCGFETSHLLFPIMLLKNIIITTKKIHPVESLYHIKEFSNISFFIGICGFFYFSSFIESYGTHIVTSATIGGRDVVYIRQHQASPLSASDIENYVKDIADQRFQDSKNTSIAAPLKYKDKVSVLAPSIDGSYCFTQSFLDQTPIVLHCKFLSLTHCFVSHFSTLELQKYLQLNSLL